MSDTTKIEWCDTTVNPIMGCEGCELRSAHVKSCYAGSLHDRYARTNTGFAPSFEQVTKFPGRMMTVAKLKNLQATERMLKPWLNGLQRLIFVSDMGDALSSSIDFPYLEQQIVDVVRSTAGRRHKWLWLTKRPERMATFSNYLKAKGISWPEHLCAGTSITTQSTVSRIDALRKVGNSETVRFLSVEPQLNAVELKENLPEISWVIQGGESGPKARPFDLNWAESVRDTCRNANVPYFLKQLGSNPVVSGSSIKLKSRHGNDWNDWNEWPLALRVRETPFERELDIFERLEVLS